MIIATLIAADRLTQSGISRAADLLAGAGVAMRGFAWIERGSAGDFEVEAGLAEVRGALAGLSGVDVVVQPAERRANRLLIADMDSTMISVECIDELADYAGIKEEVAAITERAMQGELDFEGALDARVALLAGLDEAVIEQCRQERVRLSP